MIRYVVQACRAPTCTRVRTGSRLRCVSHACRTRSRCLRPQARGTMASGGRLRSCRETGLSFVVCLSCGSLSFSLTLTNGPSYHLHTHTHTHTHSVVRNTIARSTIGGSTLLYDSSRDLTIVLTSNCLAAHPNAAREIVDLVCDLLDLGAPLDLFA